MRFAHTPTAKISFAIVAVVGLYFLWQLILMLFIAFLITVALLPLVRYLKARNVPKVVTAVGLLFILVAIPVVLALQAVPHIVQQAQEFWQEAPELVQIAEERLGTNVNTQQVVEVSQQALAQTGDVIVQATASVVSAIAALVVVVVFVVYGLIYYDRISDAIINFFAATKKDAGRYTQLLRTIEKSVGQWIKGQLLISAVVGGLAWLAYVIIGLPFAGLLAFIAAALELLPGLGPTIAAIPALLVALTVSPQAFAFTLVAYLVIQTLESYVIAPRVMGSATRINPFAVLVIVLAGTYILGIVGAIIALPVAMIIVHVYRFRTNAANSLP